jgi:hypothetical protein
MKYKIAFLFMFSICSLIPIAHAEIITLNQNEWTLIKSNFSEKYYQSKTKGPKGGILILLDIKNEYYLEILLQREQRKLTYFIYDKNKNPLGIKQEKITGAQTFPATPDKQRISGFTWFKPVTQTQSNEFVSTRDEYKDRDFAGRVTEIQINEQIYKNIMYEFEL